MTDTAAAATTPEPGAEKTTHRFEAEVEEVLRLVIHSLYSNKEIFLRELLSNASDALDKLRFRSVTEPDLLPEGARMAIRLEPDAVAKTLTIHDDGIGMTRDELVTHLGTIAKSGTRELVKKLHEGGQKPADLALIGQFGVGFYSAWLVASKVEVVSRAAGQREAWKWTSDAAGSFTVEPARRVEHGTSVTLFLRDEELEILRTWKLEELVRKWSDYLHWPIEIKVEGEKDAADAAPRWRAINKGSAIWQRSPSEVTPEQYEELYRHLTHDWEKPLLHRHFKVEGTQEFRGLLYVPRRPPFDLFSPDQKHGVRLYVKRVFIMEDCDQLLPRWLRFVRGVVDSEDLPLNVSREILQDSRITKVIRKQVVKQVLDGLTELSKSADEYATFWRLFGPVLKEGLHYEPESKDRIAPLLRFESSKGEGLVSLSAYRERMIEGQKSIFYALGENKKQIESSPHLEGLKKRGYEVLYLADPVDQWTVEAIGEWVKKEWEGLTFVSASGASLDLGTGTEEEKKKKKEEGDERTRGLRERMRALLDARVSEVRASTRLSGSPACLVVPEGGLTPHLERLLRATQGDVPQQKRILEIDPEHPVIAGLVALHEKRPDAPELDAWIEVLFDQSLIAEGSPIEDPGRFSSRVGALLADAVTRATSS